eukprot:6036566-Pleurochrysis_carterae.AAC.2
MCARTMRAEMLLRLSVHLLLQRNCEHKIFSHVVALRTPEVQHISLQHGMQASTATRQVTQRSASPRSALLHLHLLTKQPIPALAVVCGAQTRATQKWPWHFDVLVKASFTFNVQDLLQLALDSATIAERRSAVCR